jgi:excisionase family DNA binding protein
MIDNRLMTVKETKEYLNIGINTVYSLCKKADFPVVKIGNKKFIDKKLLDEVWLPNKRDTTLR